jgi:heat shock protein HslJ
MTSLSSLIVTALARAGGGDALIRERRTSGSTPISSRSARALVATGLALLATSCATIPEPASTARLTDSDWRLVHFESSDDAIGTTRPGPGERYTLHLDRDGSAAAQLFCNRGMGRWSSPDAERSSGEITIELNAMTMAACPPTPLERLPADLGRVRTFVIQNGRLHLNLMMDGGNYVWVPD